MIVATKDVPYLARQIGQHKSKYIFLLGAGVSVTAGIPTAAQIVDRLLDHFWLDSLSLAAHTSTPEPYSRLSGGAASERIQLVRTWALENVPELNALKRKRERHVTAKKKDELGEIDWGSLYPTCLGLLPGEEVRQGFIVECFKEGKGKLNFAHLLMSQLMVNNFVRIVLTTNFDDILLRALQLYFEIPAIIDADSAHTLMTTSSFAQIAYLHGRLSSYRQRHTQRELREAMPDFESFMVSVLKDHGLVIVGYRGGDEAPMKILTKILEKRRAGPGGGLFWVSYEEEVNKLSESAQSILRLKDTYWLGGWDADNFFEKLCASPGIGLSLPDFLSNPKKFAKRLEEILPEKARGPWSELQEPVPVSGVSEIDVGIVSSQAARATDHLLEGSSITAEIGTQISETRTPEEVVAFYEHFRSQGTNDAEGYFQWAVALLALDRNEEALEKYQRATELDPDFASAFLNWGRALQKLGRDEEALEKFHRATEIDPNIAGAFNLWGQGLQTLGRDEEAIEKYRRATEVAPHSSWPLAHWGHALHKLGRDEEALEKYRQATELKPRYVWALTNWGLALQKLGRDEEALEKYRRAAEIDPQSAWAFGNWGVALERLGRNEEALEKFRQATEIDPQSSWAFGNWGIALQKLGRNEEALEKYRRAVELNPNSASTFLNWGLALQKLGRNDEALEKFRRATEIDPEYAKAFANWGLVLQKLGRDGEALEKYRRAIEINPTYTWALDRCGGALVNLGRYEEALEKYRQVAGIDSNHGWAAYREGQALQKLGRTEEAIVAYKRAVELDPMKVAFRCSLAGIYRSLDREPEYKEQIELGRQLIENESEYNRACFESVCGNTDQALNLLAAALKEEFYLVAAMARRDPDLDFIRNDPRFQAFLTDKGHSPQT